MTTMIVIMTMIRMSKSTIQLVKSSEKTRQNLELIALDKFTALFVLGSIPK